MVNIFVGPKRKRYHVHKALLCDRSEYFRAMFQGGYKETEEKEVFLVDEDTSAIELFITWIYGASLKGPTDANGPFAYLGLLVVSEKFLIEQLHNQCTDLIRTYYREGTPCVRAQDIRYLYDNLSNQKMCHFLVRLAAIGALSAAQPGLSEEYQELISAGGTCAVDLAEFLTAGLGTLTSNADISDYNCAYHCHSSTEKCQGTAMRYDRFRGPLFEVPSLSR